MTLNCDFLGKCFLSGVLLALAATPAASEAYLTLGASDCARLARHYPAPPNSAGDVAFRPGRDVRGGAVAPADLNGGSELILPDTVVIPIEVDLFDRFGIPANDANFQADAVIGEVVVDVATGRATFNGQPLESEAEAELAARCQRVLRDRSAQ